MGIRRRANPDAATVVADAEGQAAWDDDAAPRSGGRRRLVGAAALGLAALVLLGVFVASRTGPDGNVLALGPASDPSDLAPVDDMGLLIEGAGPDGQSQVTPGDSIPSVPSGGDPAAVAAGGATPGGDTAGATGGGTPPGGSGAATGIAAGRGPRDGIAIPTTREGSTGPTTTVGQANPPPPDAPPPAPPPPPGCSINDVSVNPTVVQRAPSQKLRGDVRVTFRPDNCGRGNYQVRVNGLDLAAFPTVHGFYDAIIRGDAEKWGAGDHTITILQYAGAVVGVTTTTRLTVT